jgi:hypothetical protein
LLVVEVAGAGERRRLLDLEEWGIERIGRVGGWFVGMGSCDGCGDLVLNLWKSERYDRLWEMIGKHVWLKDESKR